MAPTSTEKSRLRRQLGADAASLPDDEINDLFTEAEALYSGYTRAVVFAAVRLQAWRELMAQAAKEVSYRQNASSENLSDMLKNMRAVEQSYRQMLDDAIQDHAKSNMGAWWGSMKKKPSRIQEWPDDA